MSIVLDLTPYEEANLSILAVRGGVGPEEMAAELVRQAMEQRLSQSEGSPLMAKLRQWQKETETQTAPEVTTSELFARWAQEDAAMTEEEKRAESQLWEEFEKGINENRAELGMRQL